MSDLWAVYGLTGNPFFQDPLGSDVVTRPLPLDTLFVGRQSELDLALRQVTHDQSTRLAVVGDAGVGKTTFLNRLREELRQVRRQRSAPQLITDGPTLRIVSGWTALDFCAEVLRTILLMRQARQPREVGPGLLEQLRSAVAMVGSVGDFWTRAEQIVEGRQLLGLSFQAGVGAGTQPAWAPPTLPSASLLLLTMDAIQVAQAELDGELVFMLNNLENLSREDAARAAGLFQDIRDLFLTPGSHWIVSGTREVEGSVLRASEQVSGIFPSALVLDPLTPREVSELLQRRYTALQRGMSPATPPVETTDAEHLYSLYRGDLRNFLRLLQDAVLRGAHGAAPVPATTTIALMGHEHARAIEAAIGAGAFDYLVRTVLGDRANAPVWARFRQTDAARRCGISSPAMKRHVDAWLTRRLVLPDGQQGRSEWFRLSGSTAVAMAALAARRGQSTDGLFAGQGPST